MMCAFIGLSVCMHISETTRPNFTVLTDSCRRLVELQCFINFWSFVHGVMFSLKKIANS